MKIVQKCVIAALSVMLAFFCMRACSRQDHRKIYPIPETGTWVCEELQITIYFDSRDVESIIIIEGEQIICYFGNEPGSKDIYLVCGERNNPNYYLGQDLFYGTCMEFGDVWFSVQESKSKEIYVFRKVEE